jgi:hypothetical protein
MSESDKSPFLNVGGRLRADPPQRYSGNYGRYLARGGKLRLEDDLKGYLAGGMHDGDMARFYFFSLAFDQIVKEDLSGDLAELGVYKGYSASLLANYARRLGRTAYLLDTYEGFNQEDFKGIDADQKVSFKDTSLEAVRALVGEANAKFVKGFFPATAAQLPPDATYCLVHIDCDLYAPMASALEYFYPRLVPGGFLIAHDYSSLHWNGAEKAVDEFFHDKPECVIPMPDNAGSMIIRKARPLAANSSWLDRKRRALLRPDWTEAANGNVADLLGTGWGAPEAWGVWGVGDAHVLHLVTSSVPAHDLELEFDVNAAVTPIRPEQAVDVLVGGRTLDTWTFTNAVNRGIRRLRIPVGLASARASQGASFSIEFRPRSVKTVAEISPGSVDTRPLGLGLHRIRLREG